MRLVPNEKLNSKFTPYTVLPRNRITLGPLIINANPSGNELSSAVNVMQPAPSNIPGPNESTDAVDGNRVKSTYGYYSLPFSSSYVSYSTKRVDGSSSLHDAFL